MGGGPSPNKLLLRLESSRSWDVTEDGELQLCGRRAGTVLCAGAGTVWRVECGRGSS